MQHREVVFAAFVLTILAAHSAKAQPTGDEARARVEYEAGMVLEAEGRFVEAAVHFRQALELFPNVPIAFNLGVCLRSSGEFVEAEQLFQRILNGDFGAIPSGELANVTTQLEQARAGIATLRIETTVVDGIELRIDGALRELSPEGYAELRLDPGSYLLHLGAPEHIAIERSVRLALGAATTLSLPLMRGAGEEADVEDDVTSLAPPPRRRTGLWVGISVAVVAVAAAVAIPLVVSSGSSAPSGADPYWGQIHFE